MYEVNKKKMFCDITDDFAIIINSETGIYYGINTFGTSVFENLIKGSDVNDILSALREIPGIPADIEQRLNDFIQALQEKEIIVSGPTTKNEIKIDASLAAKDEFVLSVDAYADAQELLLADPIHDVEKEIGWQPVLKD
jgi:hypothetical protein